MVSSQLKGEIKLFINNLLFLEELLEMKFKQKNFLVL